MTPAAAAWADADCAIARREISHSSNRPRLEISAPAPAFPAVHAIAKRTAERHGVALYVYSKSPGAVGEGRTVRFIAPATALGVLIVTSPYGRRHHPRDKYPSFHHGIDLRMPIGTPLKALTGGRVVKVWRETSPQQLRTGNGLVIEREGWQFSYMHLSVLFVHEGDEVLPGELVGLSGASGKRVTGPHLHFAVRAPNGRSVDPVTLYPPGTFRNA